MAAKVQKYSPEVLQTIGGILMNVASGESKDSLLMNMLKPSSIDVDPNEFKDLLSKPLWQLTGEQYKKLTEGVMLNIVSNLQSQGQKTHLIYGIDGLANFLGTSRSTAQRIKNSGIIEEAIVQRGRTIIIDGDMAMRLMKERTSKREEL